MAKYTLSQLDAKPSDYTFASTDLVLATIGTATPFVSSVKISIQQLDEALSQTTGDWVKDANGNLSYTGGHVSIGNSTIKSWATGYTAVQLGGNSVIAMADNDEADTSLNLGQNFYYDGAWKYTSADSASRLTMDDGTVSFKVAAVGAKDSTITWNNALSIAADGNVSLGTSSTEYGLTVAGSVSAQGGLSALGITSYDTGDVRVGNDLTISSNDTIVHDTPFMRSNGNYLSLNSKVSGGDTKLYLQFDSTADISMCAHPVSPGNVGIGTTSPNANAILDVTSTTKAFMPPRMTTTQRNAVSSPTAGMVVYNSTTNKLNVYTGSAWEAVTSA